MTKIHSYSLIVIILCLSCQEESQKTNNKKTEIITIDPTDIDKKSVLATTTIDSFIYIPLETSNDFMIGKIKQIYEWQNRFYIWDNMSDIIFIFSDQGEFIKRIDEKGRGPQEYIKINALYHDNINGDFYVQCDRSQAIFHYNSDGIFVERIDCKFITTEFTLLGKDTIALYGGKFPNEQIFKSTFPDQYRHVVMAHGNIITKDLSWQYNDVFLRYVGKNNYFSYFSDTTSLIEAIGNDIYRLNHNGTLMPRFSIDFGSYNLPLTFDTHSKNAKEILNTLQESSDRWCYTTEIIETPDIILINYAFEDYICHAIYSKITKKTYNIGPVWLNDIDYIGMPVIHNSTKNHLLGSLEAYTLQRTVDNPKASSNIKKIANRIQEMDNPIIVKIHLKAI